MCNPSKPSEPLPPCNNLAAKRPPALRFLPLKRPALPSAAPVRHCYLLRLPPALQICRSFLCGPSAGGPVVEGGPQPAASVQAGTDHGGRVVGNGKEADPLGVPTSMSADQGSRC